MSEPLLRIEDLTVSFELPEGTLHAVEQVSFDVPAGATVALVGESGSGKSVTAQAILRLLPEPPALIDATALELRGRDLLALSARELRRIRGASIGMVFQDPGAALDPVYSVGDQVSEALRLHGVGRREAKRRALDTLAHVGFPEPETRYRSFPHELSGGMRQRVMIAIALAASPSLLIADEPTTALDMLAAAGIQQLLRELKAERDMSLLLISHDIAAVAEVADQIVVLYAGQVVESGPAATVLQRPQHPYTASLLGSIPPLRRRRRRRRKGEGRLPVVDGTSPDPMRSPPAGCRFAPRCPDVMDRCRDQTPGLISLDEVAVRCFLAEGGARPSTAHHATLFGDEAPPGEDDEDDDALAAAEAEFERVLSAPAPRVKAPSTLANSALRRRRARASSAPPAPSSEPVPLDRMSSPKAKDQRDGDEV